MVVSKVRPYLSATNQVQLYEDFARSRAKEEVEDSLVGGEKEEELPPRTHVFQVRPILPVTSSPASPPAVRPMLPVTSSPASPPVAVRLIQCSRLKPVISSEQTERELTFLLY